MCEWWMASPAGNESISISDGCIFETVDCFLETLDACFVEVVLEEELVSVRNDDDAEFINKQIADLQKFVEENYAGLQKLLKKRKKRKPGEEAAVGADDDDMEEDDADEDEGRRGKKSKK